MSEFLIYRASAGSGKTFELVLKYLEKVFNNRSDYRSILAVTFTNKAADEMKGRILEVLNKLAVGPEQAKANGRLAFDPKYWPYLDKLIESLDKPADWISKEAAAIKSMMLHDYSRISVDTIDSFFQGILRSFARESGLSSSFQLEMDTDKVLGDFAADIFMQADTKPGVRAWLIEWINQRMESGEKWHRLEADLIRTGQELLKEEILDRMLGQDSGMISESGIAKVREEAFRLIRQFRNGIDSIRTRTREHLSAFDLSPADFPYGISGPAGYLYKLDYKSPNPGSRSLQSVDQLARWIDKKKEKSFQDEVASKVYPGLNQLMKETINLFEDQYLPYHSALAVSRNLFALWFSSSFFDFLREYAREKNLILMSLTQPIIRLIINDNPSPFIFEKTGVFIKHYLIDEFQDTSDLQWKNFRPLVENSLSEAGLSMVVGDVKQSLYRWRNSNWKLLHSEAARDMLHFGLRDIPLIENHRSREVVIRFNNHIFKKLPDIVQNLVDKSYDSAIDGEIVSIPEISNVYNTVEQEHGAKAGLPGLVDLRFYNSREEADPWRDWIAGQLPGVVEDLLYNRGYNQQDILFLVRRNKEGDQISEILTRHFKNSDYSSREPWAFISADVFRITSSSAIKIIINAFRYLTDTKVRYYLDLLKWEMFLRFNPAVDSSPDLDHPMFNGLESRFEEIKTLDPLAATDEIVRFFKLDDNDEDLPYLYQFRDQVRAFCLNESGHLKGFIDWWDLLGNKQMLVTEGNSEAMRIMTIHKAKGLSSPVVIIPYCNWEFDHSLNRGPWLWVDTKGTPYNAVPSIPVKYSSRLNDTLFRDNYLAEKAEAAIDSLNLLYVAFTRPVDILIAFCPYKSNQFTVADALFKSLEKDIKDGRYMDGDAGFKRPDGPLKIQPEYLDLKSFHFHAGRKMPKPSEETSPEAVRYGTLVHSILESVRQVDDLAMAVDQFTEAGDLDEPDVLRIRQILGQIFLMPEIKEWFGKTWEIMTEPVILVPGSSEKRPDRVMIRGKEVIVLDYKTGGREIRHQDQVVEYMNLVKEMGYEAVRGYLLYLDEPALAEVRSPAGFSRLPQQDRAF